MIPSCFRRREGRGLQQCYKPRIRPVSPVETMPECQARCECLWRKMVGKPYSGKPNVRIDEGELEIERSATTPALYSTEQCFSHRPRLKPKYLIAEIYGVVAEQLEHREIAISSLDSHHTAPGVDRMDNAFRYFRFQ